VIESLDIFIECVAMSKLQYDFLNASTAPHVFSRNPIQSRIMSLLLTMAYSHLFVSLRTSGIYATVLFGLLYDSHTNTMLLEAWYAMSLTVTLLRIQVLKIHKRFWTAESGLLFWRGLFVFSTVLGGLAWAFLGSVIFSHALVWQQIIIIIMLNMVAASGAVTLASERSSAFLFSALITIPLMWSLSHAAYFHSFYTVCYAEFACLIFLIYLSEKSYMTLKEILELDMKNQFLLLDLERAKNDLQITNITLAEASTHDMMTGAGNQGLFEKQLKKAIQNAVLLHKRFALLYMDIDNFKSINDRFGHLVGDKLLIEFSVRVRKVVSEAAKVYRVGGDEFVVILENISEQRDIEKIANHLCHTIATPIELNGNRLSVSVSVGVSFYPDDGLDQESLLYKADQAMYKIKQGGKNNFMIYGHENPS
jgi:diguanylate cyclase (GGDEF)-like protein